jgi:tripartite-type tricarboxylate transporter receptor subunit TctC
MCASGRNTHNNKARNVLRLLTCVCLVVATLAVSQASAESVEEFYKRKGLTLIVGNGPGGGFDVFSRLLARHFSEYVPGHPAIVVQNMPGAGSLLAANYLYTVAPKDGTTFGLISRNMLMLGLMGQNSSVRFDPRKFTWLGSSSNFSNDAYVLIARKNAPIQSIDDMRRGSLPLLVMGGTANGASSADVPRLLRDTLGINFRLVLGYRDSAAIFLAMETGEVSGRMVELSSIRATRPAWLKPDSDFHFLLQYGRVTRHPDFPDVPTARELAETDLARALIEFTEIPMLTMAWPFVAPPGVPEERTQALRQAFAAAHRNHEYLAEAAAAGVDVNPVNADDIVRSIDQLSRAPPDVFDYVRRLLSASKGGG